MNQFNLPALWPWLLGWLVFGLVGTLVLYVGYGFAMAAKRARDLRLSQAWVVGVDAVIALPFLLLDFLLNLLFFSVLLLDFRPRYSFTLITARLCRYSEDPDERKFRKATADFFAAFLDGKDPSGDHIKGANQRLPWLD